MIARSAILPALALLLPVSANAVERSPLLGKWRTEKQNGVVEIRPCGAALCGYVIDGAPLRANPDQRDIRNTNMALRNRQVMNLRVLSNFAGGPREWTGGAMYDPDTGDGASSGSITLESADTLKVRGCIAVILCRTQKWTRLR